MIPFQVALCAFTFAFLVSASAQSSPSPRSAHSAAWDAARGELVVFGGFAGRLPTDETWVWNGTWTLKNPTNRPPARVYANMVYDEARQQVVLFGGSEDAATGSAAGPLAVHVARHGLVPFGEEIEISQGAELGRPSKLYARAEGSAEQLDRVEVGGSAVVVARGEFRLP